MKRHKDKLLSELVKLYESECKDESPAELETNGPETRNGIIANSPLVNARKEPYLGSGVVEVLNRDDKVTILDNDQYFYKVLTPKNNVAYVHSNYIKEE